MVCEHVRVPVTLSVLGPLLTAGETHASWGVDITFYRDWRGKYALPASHVRGKLREGMNEVLRLSGAKGRSLEEWFGRKSTDEHDKTQSYFPNRGCLKVSEFTLKSKNPLGNQKNVQTRIRIDPVRLTVVEGALLRSEAPFRSGEVTEWQGWLEFFSEPENTGTYIAQINHAFLFVTTIGAEKTVGYGRLQKVVFGKVLRTALGGRVDGLKLAIAPEEPLLIGGIRRTENIFESEKIIPGGVLKGALAAGLNRLAGNPNQSAFIGESNLSVKALCPCLTSHFSNLIFLHAVPSLNKFERIETIPLSGVTYGGTYGGIYKDVLFSKPENIWANGPIPVAFQIDWKGLPGDLPPEYSLPELEYHSVTRTAIDTLTRRADESKLYSFRMLKPKIAGKGFEDNPKQVYWNSRILFPESISDDQRNGLAEELFRVLPLALRYLGKRQSIVTVDAERDTGKPEPPRHKPKRFALTLQSPALMIDPEELTKESRDVFDDLAIIKNHYSSYWNAVLCGSVTLDTFYASQQLLGGFVGMRFMKGSYRPFYLTAAGSTFVFQISGWNDAYPKINALSRDGLPLPSWARQIYGDEPWKSCPYVPENGYGEVTIRYQTEEGDSHE